MSSLITYNPFVSMSWRQYTPLQDGNQDEGLKGTATESTQRRSTSVSSTTSIAVTILAVCSMIALLTALKYEAGANETTKLQKQQACVCGTSAAEARANGCKFDFYSMAWLPQHCLDEELISWFDEAGRRRHHNWTLLVFPDAERQVSIDEAALLAGDPFKGNEQLITTTRDWHGAHCLYTLLKHFRHRRTKLGMSKRYLTEQHAEHCVDYLLGVVVSDANAADIDAVSLVDVYSD